MVQWNEEGAVGFVRLQEVRRAQSVLPAPPIAHLTRTDYAYHPISSRAHLLDIPRYLAKHDLPPLKPLSRETPVKLEWLEACAEESGVVFRPGDILLVRIGWTEAYLALSEDERRAVKDRQGPGVGQGGVQQGEAMLRWHWDNGIAAVVGDTSVGHLPRPTSCRSRRARG